MQTGAVAILAASAIACDQGPEIPELDGHWSGSVETVVITLTLIEDGDGEVSGSGLLEGLQVDAPGGQLAVSVEGAHAHPTVSLTLTAAGQSGAGAHFTGELSDDHTIRGSLVGAGFNHALTLRRQ